MVLSNLKLWFSDDDHPTQVRAGDRTNYLETWNFKRIAHCFSETAMTSPQKSLQVINFLITLIILVAQLEGRWSKWDPVFFKTFPVPDLKDSFYLHQDCDIIIFTILVFGPIIRKSDFQVFWRIKRGDTEVSLGDNICQVIYSFSWKWNPENHKR